MKKLFNNWKTTAVAVLILGCDLMNYIHNHPEIPLIFAIPAYVTSDNWIVKLTALAALLAKDA